MSVGFARRNPASPQNRTHAVYACVHDVRALMNLTRPWRPTHVGVKAGAPPPGALRLLLIILLFRGNLVGAASRRGGGGSAGADFRHRRNSYSVFVFFHE